MKVSPSLRLAGNWKMNPETIQEARRLFTQYRRLAEQYPQVQLEAFVPAVYLAPLSKARQETGLRIGAQNIYIHDHGSYTGAISVPMVQSLGVNQVLIGHSERRTLFGVKDEIITQKIQHALDHDMPMTVCFGEEGRDSQGVYTEVLEEQLATILTPLSQRRKTSLLTLAYEPIWAIGAEARRAVSEDELFSTLILIRNIIGKHLGATQAKKIPLLYGGSVKGENAVALSGVPGVDGFLIGRASLSKASLEAIIQAVV